jgi:hypothetical protein
MYDAWVALVRAGATPIGPAPPISSSKFWNFITWAQPLDPPQLPDDGVLKLGLIALGTGRLLLAPA